MIQKDPSQIMYFDITVRPLHIRLNQHLYSGKDLDVAVMDFRFSELVGNQHLRNKTADGDYHLPDMNRPGVLYVLIFKNRVTPETPVPDINFRIRGASHLRAFPIITRQHHIELPKFNKMVGIADITVKLGYETRHNAKQAPRYRAQRCLSQPRNVSTTRSESIRNS
jgi:hypothetical protein